MKKSIITALSAIAITITCSSSAYAKVDGITVKDLSTGNFYEYGYADLINESENSAIGLESIFFDEYRFRQNGIVAFHDDKKGYMNSKEIMQAAEDSAISEEIFDLQKFIDKAPDTIKITPEKDVQIRILKNGKIVDGEVRHKNKNFIASIEVKSSPLPGSTIIIVTPTEELNVNSYSVLIGDVEARFANGKFVGTVQGTYTTETAKDIVKIQPKESSENKDIQLARQAVCKAETSKSIEDINAARNLVTNLQDANVKAELNAKLDTLEKSINEDSDFDVIDIY